MNATRQPPQWSLALHEPPDADSTISTVKSVEIPTKVGQLQVDPVPPSLPDQAVCNTCSEQLSQNASSMHPDDAIDPISATGCQTDGPEFKSDVFNVDDVGPPKTIPQRSFEDLGLSFEGATIAESEKECLKELVKEFNDIFALQNSELTGCVLGTLKLRPRM